MSEEREGLSGFPKEEEEEQNGENVSAAHCFICNSTDVSQNSFNALYTILPRSGILLSDKIKNVLCCNWDTAIARSSVTCSRCFTLFEELNIAEERCAEIKKEIRSSFVQTAKEHGDDQPIYLTGVACQTDLDDNNLNLESGYSSYTRKCSARVILDSEDEFSSNEGTKLSKQRTRRKSRRLCNGEAKNYEEYDIDILEEIALKDRIHINRHSVRCKQKKKAPSGDANSEDSDDDEVEGDKAENFSKDFLNCDDDFEWKEEVAVQNAEVKGTPSEGTPNTPLMNMKFQINTKRAKKRKRLSRRGERALLPPVHECLQCGKKFRTITELKAHISSHSAIRPYVCEICGQAYKMKKALDIHIGMHNGIHPFVCSYCNKSFTQKVGLEKHLPIHTGVTRFQCDLCGKRFIHLKSFNIHKMTHTGEKNVKCPICNLAVFSRSHLKRHYRVHTGERPYACDTCGKKFAEKYNLNAHMKIHSSPASVSRRRNHRCPVCGEIYEKKQKMVEHLSSTHYMWNSNEAKQQEYYLQHQQQQNVSSQKHVASNNHIHLQNQQQHPYSQQKRGPPDLSNESGFYAGIVQSARIRQSPCNDTEILQHPPPPPMITPDNTQSNHHSILAQHLLATAQLQSSLQSAHHNQTLIDDPSMFVTTSHHRSMVTNNAASVTAL